MDVGTVFQESARAAKLVTNTTTRLIFVRKPVTQDSSSEEFWDYVS